MECFCILKSCCEEFGYWHITFNFHFQDEQLLATSVPHKWDSWKTGRLHDLVNVTKWTNVQGQKSDLTSRDKAIYATIWFQGLNHQDTVCTSWNKVKTQENTSAVQSSVAVHAAQLVPYLRLKAIILSLLASEPAAQLGGGRRTNKPNIPNLLVNPE